VKPHPSSNKNAPVENLGNPNDDGCVLGTAGRDEDPNATTDWDHESDSAGNVQTPDDAHGMPGYPGDSQADKADPVTRQRSGKGERQTGINPLEQDNDGAD
jgi:hypothetical protein